MEQLPQKRKGGRPKGGALSLDWNYVDRLLVHGEKVLRTEPGTGKQSFEHVYPGYREVAARVGVSNARIGQYAKEHNVLERRKLAQIAKTVDPAERAPDQASGREEQAVEATGSMAARQHGSVAAEQQRDDGADPFDLSGVEAETPDPFDATEVDAERSEAETPESDERPEGLRGEAEDSEERARRAEGLSVPSVRPVIPVRDSGGAGAAPSGGGAEDAREPYDVNKTFENASESDDWDDLFDEPKSKPEKKVALQTKQAQVERERNGGKLPAGVVEAARVPEDPFETIAPPAPVPDDDSYEGNGSVATVQNIVAARKNLKKTIPDPRGNALPVPKAVWDKVDELLVYGIKFKDADGMTDYRYPTGREIAQMLGISDASVSAWRHQKMCDKRRQEVEEKRYKKAGYDLTQRLDKLDGSSVPEDDTAARVLRVAKKFLIRFETALDENRINITNVADLDRIVRLAQLVNGQADSRKEVKQVVSMEEITRRYSAARQITIEVNNEMAGVIEDAEIVEDEIS